MSERTFEISDIDGRNRRVVTMEQFRAELDARKEMAKAVSDALRRGDFKACEAAQAAMRERFA